MLLKPPPIPASAQECRTEVQCLLYRDERMKKSLFVAHLCFKRMRDAIGDAMVYCDGLWWAYLYVFDPLASEGALKYTRIIEAETLGKLSDKCYSAFAAQAADYESDHKRQ